MASKMERRGEEGGTPKVWVNTRIVDLVAEDGGLFWVWESPRTVGIAGVEALNPSEGGESSAVAGHRRARGRADGFDNAALSGSAILDRCALRLRSDERRADAMEGLRSGPRRRGGFGKWYPRSHRTISTSRSIRCSGSKAKASLGYKLRPPVHQVASLLEQVWAGIRPFHGASYLMGQGRLSDGMWCGGLLTSPVPERGAETVHRATVTIDLPQSLGQRGGVYLCTGSGRSREAQASRTMQALGGLQRF